MGLVPEKRTRRIERPATLRPPGGLRARELRYTAVYEAWPDVASATEDLCMATKNAWFRVFTDGPVVSEGSHQAGRFPLRCVSRPSYLNPNHTRALARAAPQSCGPRRVRGPRLTSDRRKGRSWRFHFSLQLNARVATTAKTMARTTTMSRSTRAPDVLSNTMAALRPSMM